MPVGLGPAQVNAALQTLAASPICTLDELPHRTHEDRPVYALMVGAANDPSSRPTVLIVGGVHAREIAPVDAVLSFATVLVEAFDAGGDAVWPAVFDPLFHAPWELLGTTYPAGPKTIPEHRIAASEVSNLLHLFTFVFVPLANPDGRAHVFVDPQTPANREWRGNRNVTTLPGGDRDMGVDLNRNFDVAWDVDDVYSDSDADLISTPPAATSLADLQGPVFQTVQVGPSNHFVGEQMYQGPGAGSEPETQNLQDLVDDLRPALVLDVHSHGRDILIPWAMAAAQSNDPAQTLHDDSLGRDAGGPGRQVTDLTYQEYTSDASPTYLDSTLARVANRMAAEIIDWAGPDPDVRDQSRYEPSRTARWTAQRRHVTTLVDVLPTPGGFDDYAMARQFRAGASGHTLVYLLECGSARNGEDGFTPPAGPKFEKIEREVHAAIIGMLTGYRGSQLGRDALGGGP